MIRITDDTGFRESLASLASMLIDAEDVPTSDESEQQYRMLSDYLNS